jgi:hypothetical protein
MSLAAGIVEYMLGTPPVTGCGVSWTAEELDTALAGPVAPVVFDHEGTADIAALLESLPDTDFESDELAKILNYDTPPKNWEVGEALAEVYLTQHRNSYFPWPDGRDIRKPKSSLPGADMSGFYGNDEKTRFAFGEVKTSKENKYPPQVVKYGEHSLNKQLTDLRDKRSLRDKVVAYLGHRATKSDWKKVYQSAVKNYLKTGGTGVAIFGVLVRDVLPNSDDLEASRQLLSDSCPANALIELLAIYLPSGSIDSLSDKVTATGKGGVA